MTVAAPHTRSYGKQLSMSLICDEEKLSESQQKVYKEWEKRVKEYDEQMKKHKEEEEKYKKAVKAVDTRVGLKDSERQIANGPTKFLRALPNSNPQPSTTTDKSSVSPSAGVHARASSSNIGHPGISIQRHNSGQNVTVNINGRQQLAYGGTQLGGRQQLGVASTGVRMLLNAPPQPKAVPGVSRPGSYLVQNGIRPLGMKPINTTNARSGNVNPTLQAGMKQLSQYASNASQHQPGITDASRGVKRPADSTSPQENKRVKETIDSKTLMKYYPLKKGKLLTTEDTSRRFKIKCFHCNETMASNVQYATHVKKIVESQWPDSSNLSAMVVCPRCFKRFRTPFEMQEHLERSHVKGSVYQCFTCDLSFGSNDMLLKHMNMFHSIAQMPFRCQICEYRTSAYADIIEHFSLKHEGYKALMCPYCLKMLRCSKTFLQHCQKHIQLAMRVTGGTFPCKCCKLSFLTTAERNEHSEKDHVKFDARHRDGVPRYVRDTLKSLEIMASAGITSTSTSTSTSNPPTPKMNAITSKYTFTQHSSLNKKLACMECGLLFSNVASHFAVKLQCSKCPYTSSCPKSLSNHMIIFHKLGKEPPFVGKVSKKKSSDGTITLTCKVCNYQTKAPTHMAHHRAKKCVRRTPIEWISYLFVPAVKKPQSVTPAKLVDVIVLDSDED